MQDAPQPHTHAHTHTHTGGRYRNSRGGSRGASEGLWCAASCSPVGTSASATSSAAASTSCAACCTCSTGVCASAATRCGAWSTYFTALFRSICCSGPRRNPFCDCEFIPLSPCAAAICGAVTARQVFASCMIDVLRDSHAGRRRRGRSRRAWRRGKRHDVV